jgi:WD40 repeat protein
MDNQTDDQQLIIDDSEESFIKEGEAVEVEVDDNDIPMDDDGDDEVDAVAGDISTNAKEIPDMSIQKLICHNSSSVYAVASHHDPATNSLSIITGGGDDKAFLHKLDNNNTVKTIQLSHAHTDSVSSVASNEKLVSTDLSKTPKYLAVGAYDGSVVLYNPDNGEKIKVLDGPTDVEFLSFHPKGGSVSCSTYYERLNIQSE